jgi:SAM-dependent methyltransferase
MALGGRAQIAEDDVRTADFGRADGIVILDVLHYIEYADQRRILERVRRALAPDGVLLLRVGDAAGGLGFTVSTWVDRMVLLARGGGMRRLCCRSTAQWRELLSAIGFDSESVPMSAGTPFVNVLIIAKPRCGVPS